MEERRLEQLKEYLYYISSENRDINKVELFIEKEIDLIQSHFLTLIKPIIANDFSEALVLFLEHPFITFENEVFIIAIEYNAINCFNLLLKEPSITPSFKKEQAFILACVSHNRFDMVQTLLKDNRIQINKDVSLILELTAESSNFEILDLLLTDPRFKPDWGLLAVICKYRKEEVVLNFIKKLTNKYSFNVKSNDILPLLVASEYGHFQVFKFLIDKFNLDICNISAVHIKLVFERKYYDILTFIFQNEHLYNSFKTYDNDFFLEVQNVLLKDKVEQF